jgi:hypothetical protein
MVFNATFNNISVIWLQSVLLVEETAVLHNTASNGIQTHKVSADNKYIIQIQTWCKQV